MTKVAIDKELFKEGRLIGRNPDDVGSLFKLINDHHDRLDDLDGGIDQLANAEVRSSDLLLDHTSPPTPSAGLGFVLGSGNEGLVAQLASPGMAVRIQTGGFAYNHLGRKLVVLTTASLAIDASDPSDGRKDIVVVDANGALKVRKGTPSGFPADPTLTAGDVPLARVTVDAAATQILTAKIADLRNRKPINGAKILNGSIPTAAVADGAVTFAKAKVFVSTEQTGTGSPQDVAHGLGATPTAVIAAPTELAADLAAGYDCAEGAHDSTNVKVTVTTGAKFKVMAWV